MATPIDLDLIKSGIDVVMKIQTKNGRETWQEIAPVIDCKQGYYKSRIISGFKDASVYGRGAPVVSDRKKSVFEQDYYPLQYAKAWEFDVNDKDEDVYNELSSNVADIAIAMRRRKNKEGANIFNYGFDASVLIYDGQTLFSTAHPGAAGVTGGANRPASGSSLGPALFESAIAAMMSQVDVNGESMEFEGNMEVVVGNSLYLPTKRIVTALQLAQSNDNDPNVLRDYLTLKRNDKITSTTAVYFKAQNVDEHGLRTIQFSPYRIDSGPEVRTGMVVNVVRERYRCVVLQWQGTYADPGA